MATDPLSAQKAEAYAQQAHALTMAGQVNEALALYDSAIALCPVQPGLHHHRAGALYMLGRLPEALAGYEHALKLEPTLADSWFGRGHVLYTLGRLDDALSSLDRGLAFAPNTADAQCTRANVLMELQRPAEAVAGYDRALALSPSASEAQNNRGVALLGLGRPAEALADFDRVLALHQAFPDAHNNRAHALLSLGRPEEALTSCENALALRPDYPEAYNNRGNALLELNRAEEAVASYDQALALGPGLAQTHHNRGTALLRLQRLEAALSSFDRALALQALHADAHNNRALTLLELGRLDEALINYERALALKPDEPFLRGTVVHTRMKICDWSRWRENLEELRAGVAAGSAVTVPFALLSLIDDPELHKRATEIYVAAKYSVPSSLGPALARQGHHKIRIGYYSSDFREHPVAHLIAPLLNAHDRERFEVIGFSFAPYAEDAMSAKVRAELDTFIDVRDVTDRAIAQMSRDMAIDIAVDLNGHTQHARPGIFAERCAPVQAQYLGYLGTMGAPFIDYIIADGTVIPESHHVHFTENVVSLPHTHQINGTERILSRDVPTRRELGLPDTGFVFCCFNNSYKIQPATFDSWMRILNAATGSVLWLVDGSELTSRNLRGEAQKRGVDPNRLVFSQRVSFAQFLARQQCADLFLDTLPYNAGTTASDALWSGLPVLTCMGKSFASRAAASLLRTIGLPELVTDTSAAYEAMAIRLATDPAQFDAVRRKLAANRLSSPLFDSRLFARHIETAYVRMHARAQAGLPPQAFAVDRIQL